MGDWIDGGASARILSSSTFAATGSYSFYVQGDAGLSSSVYTTPQDYSEYNNLRISFNYYAYAVETGDQFVVEVDNGSGSYSVVHTLIFGQDFQNFDRTSTSFIVDDFDLSNAVSLRIRAEGTEAADYFILDDILIEGCGEQTQSCTPGLACTSNDACYVGSVYDADCNCVGGTFLDNDGDGFCAAEDSNDNDPCVPDGSSCGGDTGGGTDCQEISSVGFEGNQLGIWNDGGSSARLLNSATFAPSGQYSFYLQGDNGVASSLFSNSCLLYTSPSPRDRG